MKGNIMKQLTIFIASLSLLLSGCIPQERANDQNQTALFEAIRNHDLEKVKTIVTETNVNLDPPTQPNMVNKALAYASIYGNLEIVKFILSQGVEIDGKVAYGGTPLLRAMEVDNNDIAEYLIKSGADVNIPNAFGISPMVGSAISNNINLMDLIITHGGDINKAHKMTVSTGYGELAFNPIQWAIVKNNKESVENLISAGASLDVKTSDNESLIELAKKRSSPEIASLIESQF
jgi:ankyrin repeat protein